MEYGEKPETSESLKKQAMEPKRDDFHGQWPYLYDWFMKPAWVTSTRR